MGKNSLCAKVNRNSFLCKEVSRRQTPLFLGHEQITTLLFRSGGPPAPISLAQEVMLREDMW